MKNDEFEKALWKDYKDLSDLYKVLDDGDDKRHILLDERDKVREELLKLELSKIENGMKEKEINAEDNREKIRNRITIITFAISTGLSLYAIVRTFRFDQESTVTSTLGRNILNGMLPKMFKR